MRKAERFVSRAAALALLAVLLVPAAAWAQAEIPAPPPTREEVAFDAAVLRPLRFSALVVGAGLFVPAAILTAPSGKKNLEAVLDYFVLEPAKAVFVQPLGKW
jgi:hypothetical protein